MDNLWSDIVHIVDIVLLILAIPGVVWWIIVLNQRHATKQYEEEERLQLLRQIESHLSQIESHLSQIEFDLSDLAMRSRINDHSDV